MKRGWVLAEDTERRCTIGDKVLFWSQCRCGKIKSVADAIADSLTKTVTDLHSDLFETEPKRWNPLAGQYLVYGTLQRTGNEI